MELTARQFIKEVGIDTLRNALRLSEKSIGAAYTANVMPPRWAKVVRHLAAERGISVAESAFKWRDPSQSRARE